MGIGLSCSPVVRGSKIIGEGGQGGGGGVGVIEVAVFVDISIEMPESESVSLVFIRLFSPVFAVFKLVVLQVALKMINIFEV